jgi:type I restriction-modification system DNA methylase subunit
MDNTLFQTPLEVAEFMAKMIPEDAVTVLEPTPGKGNILNFLDKYK